MLDVVVLAVGVGQEVGCGCSLDGRLLMSKHHLLASLTLRPTHRRGLISRLLVRAQWTLTPGAWPSLRQSHL